MCSHHMAYGGRGYCVEAQSRRNATSIFSLQVGPTCHFVHLIPNNLGERSTARRLYIDQTLIII